MARRNGVDTIKIQVSIDAVTDRVLQEMIGLPGKSKGEVASWIIREWIWHGSEALERIGVSLRKITPPLKPTNIDKA